MKPNTPRKIIHLTRRQVLIGAGGFSLALPVLPSLLVSKAYGADPQFVRRPRLYWLTTNHGAAFESNMFPSAKLLTQSQQLFADHSVRAGKLVATPQGANAVLSPVLQADALQLTPRRIQQLNVLQGLDISFAIGHNTGGYLGNFARNDALAGEGLAVKDFPRPTVDQLLAWSPTFYDDLGATRERALLVGPQPSLSWNYSNPAAGSGTIQNVRAVDSSLELFNRIFVPATTSERQARMPVVDHVLESYKRLRNGNRRLSMADRQRLDDHVDRVAELQRKLNAGNARSCAGVVPPTDDALNHLDNDPTQAARHAQLFNEVVATAFMCGSSRIAVFGMAKEERFVAYNGDWHNDIAHAWQSPDKQALLTTAYQRIFEHVFVDMIARLDVEEAPGMTYLDNALLVWSQEAGMSTHSTVSLPVVTAGSAAGFLSTGSFIDYRRVGDPNSQFDPQYNGYLLYAGLLYNQFLATVLRAMGLAPSEFERWGYKGYGYPMVMPAGTGTFPFGKHYENTSSRYFQIASEPLPFLRSPA